MLWIRTVRGEEDPPHAEGLRRAEDGPYVEGRAKILEVEVKAAHMPLGGVQLTPGFIVDIPVRGGASEEGVELVAESVDAAPKALLVRIDLSLLLRLRPQTIAHPSLLAQALAQRVGNVSDFPRK
jgi:hypothetical protein